MGDPDDPQSGDGRRIKVVRLIDEYGLDGVGADLEERWTTRGDERMSLRSLANFFNRLLLREEMTDVGMSPLSGEVENVYVRLTDDAISEADRTRTRRRLEREGVDVDRLLEDFVSYQAIRSYLQEHRGAVYERANQDRISVEEENLQRLQGRITAVADSKLDQLQKSGDLLLGDPHTIVEISVVCRECGQRYDIQQLLGRGGCACKRRSDA